jgi:MFS family permease
MGWGNPAVIAAIVGGVLMLALFVWIEKTVDNPMFRIPLFRIPAFTRGNIANLMASLGRGGLQFMLILWLQGIWLPQHGYSFSQTPLWAGIYMVPLTVGFFVAGPVSGALSDRYGPWAFATSGMVGTAASFALLAVLPIDFSYVSFALILLLMGISQGLFASPNRAAVMNALPAEHRGAGAGMYATFQNSAQVLSIGVFFTVVTIGLASTLPHTLSSGLIAHGVPAADAHHVGNEPPIGALFASFLGLNPVKTLLPPAVLGHLSAGQQATLTGQAFFPSLISAPFATGLDFAFGFAVVCSIIGALACGNRRQYTASAPEGARPPTPEMQAVAGRHLAP